MYQSCSPRINQRLDASRTSELLIDNLRVSQFRAARVNSTVGRLIGGNVKSLALTVFLIGLLCSLGLHAAAAWHQKLTQADEDAIREAVFRYQFEHDASGRQQKANVYFLSIGTDKDPQDPSDAFMARFVKHQPPVKKGSQATGQFQVIDKETGERGVSFRVTSIKQVDVDKVMVDGGYYETSDSSSGNTYTVERKDHKWSVTADRLRWISSVSPPPNKLASEALLYKRILETKEFSVRKWLATSEGWNDDDEPFVETLGEGNSADTFPLLNP
jgi:hypothetical protein